MSRLAVSRAAGRLGAWVDGQMKPRLSVLYDSDGGNAIAIFDHLVPSLSHRHGNSVH